MASTVSTEPPRLKPLQDYLWGWPILGVVVITIWASFWTFDLVEYAVINTVYGTDAWNSGLRVIDNKGRLSDGSELTRFHRVVLHFGSYLLSVPFFFGSVFGLAYLNMRFHGKRLSDFTTRRDGPQMARRRVHESGAKGQKMASHKGRRPGR